MELVLVLPALKMGHCTSWTLDWTVEWTVDWIVNWNVDCILDFTVCIPFPTLQVDLWPKESTDEG